MYTIKIYKEDERIETLNVETTKSVDLVLLNLNKLYDLNLLETEETFNPKNGKLKAVYQSPTNKDVFVTVDYE